MAAHLSLLAALSAGACGEVVFSDIYQKSTVSPFDPGTLLVRIVNNSSSQVRILMRIDNETQDRQYECNAQTACNIDLDPPNLTCPSRIRLVRVSFVDPSGSFAGEQDFTNTPEAVTYEAGRDFNCGSILMIRVSNNPVRTEVLPL